MVDTDQVRGMMVVAEADFGLYENGRYRQKRRNSLERSLKITYDVLHFYVEALFFAIV